MSGKWSCTLCNRENDPSVTHLNCVDCGDRKPDETQKDWKCHRCNYKNDQRSQETVSDTCGAIKDVAYGHLAPFLTSFLSDYPDVPKVSAVHALCACDYDGNNKRAYELYLTVEKLRPASAAAAGGGGGGGRTPS